VGKVGNLFNSSNPVKGKEEEMAGLHQESSSYLIIRGIRAVGGDRVIRKLDTGGGEGDLYLVKLSL